MKMKTISSFKFRVPSFSSIIFFLLFFALFVDEMLFAQTAPSGYTANFRFRKYAQGANPGADSLNANWTEIDWAIYNRGWQIGASKVYQIVPGAKTYFRTAAGDTSFGGRLVNVKGSLFIDDSLIVNTKSRFGSDVFFVTGFRNVGNAFGAGQVGFMSGEIVLSNSPENDFQTRGGQFAINRKDTTQPSNIRYAATIVNQFRGNGGVGYVGEGGLYVVVSDQSTKPTGVGQGVNIDIRAERENGNAWGGTGGTYNVNNDTYALGITANGSKFIIDGIFMDAGVKTATTQNPNGIGINGGITMGGRYSYMISASSGSQAHVGIDLTQLSGFGGASDRAIATSVTSRSDFGKISIQGNPTISSGTGSPEGAITATPGSIYLNNNGGANTSVFFKESGTGATGWVAK